MAGLGAAMKPQQGAQPMAASEETASPGEQASPEEQALYDDFVGRAQSILLPQKGEVSGEILANLRGDFDPQAAQVFAQVEPPLAPSPQDAVSGTAVLLTLMIEASAMQEGIDYPDDVAMHAGAEVVEMLAAVSEAAGIHDFSDEEMEGMFYRALDLYRYVGPRIDENALKQGFEQIVQADQAGKLNEVLPGLPGGAPMQKKGAAA